MSKSYEKKSYEPINVDAKWRKKWDESACFKANAHSAKPAYTIVIPPPNVTGVLHMGHALGFTLQDILIRWKRMLGFETLWLPGTDHAGIATQTVVERHLIETEGKRRTDYDRETFLSHVWEWKEKNESRIVNQIKMMGCSCDWSRARFTMDEGCNLAVRKAFKRLYDKQLIVQGNYLVNWDPETQTALADDEVEYEEREGHLYFFKYPLADNSGFIEIATTRPETLLGDTAVAVHPDDARYSALIGKQLRLPLMDRLLPIIADWRISPEFGTGAVKITPAHDPNDYQIGLDHELPFINLLNPDGTLNANAGSFAGLSMQAARLAVVDAMKKAHLFVNSIPHQHRVGVSYRSKAVIEPYLSKQWFVRMGGFAKKLRAAVEEERVKIIPENWTKTYFHWIDNLHDWCISRQLWWGHRIPIWHHKTDEGRMICYDGEGLPPEVAKEPDSWRQDEDVLDTWFSSALWPFSTLGWPHETEDLKKFYPTSVLETGHDILFFWVARMLMMGEECMGQLPFPETYLHGLIYGKSYWTRQEGGVRYITGAQQAAYDSGAQKVPENVHSKWEKMSKSKGNIIDPLEIIEQYGTDAMRMGLASSATQAREIDLDRRKFEDFKNFANKIWNGARFVLMNIAAGDDPLKTAPTGAQLSQGLDLSLFQLEDHWILSTLQRTIEAVNKHLNTYAFDLAAATAYDFFWKEFCAYYVEIVKPYLFGKQGTPEQRLNKQKLLIIVLNNALRLLHPMAPFITEELFEALKEILAPLTQAEPQADSLTQETLNALQTELCCIAPYPLSDASWINPQAEEAFQLMSSLVYTIRNIRSEMQLAPGATIDVHLIRGQNQQTFESLAEHIAIAKTLVRIQTVHLHENEQQTMPFCAYSHVEGVKIAIPFPQEYVEKEKERLFKEKEKLLKSIEQYQNQLENGDFLAKAPAALVDKTRKQLQMQQEQLNEIHQKLS